MNKMNVLVVDDHQQILDMTRQMLKDCTKIGVIDTFSDGLSACVNLSKRLYELCIVDLRLPRMDGFALVEQIRKQIPDAKIIVNTMCDELWDAKRIMELEVEGIVIKTSSLAHLEEAIDAVLAGDKYRCPKFRQLVKQQDTGSYLNLSQRESEVLNAIAEGLTTDEISQLYSISDNTVESIRKRLLVKMDARNMAQLVSKAHKIGLITNYRTDAPPD